MTDAGNGMILVAIDGSDNSLLAAGVGARLARLLNAHLGFVHILDVPTLSFWVGVEARMKQDIRSQAEARLTEIANRIGETCDVVPEFYIVEGIPEQEILRIVTESQNVLMVVAGRRGVATEKKTHPRWRQTMGRLTSKLSEHLPVPLVIVPPDVPLSHICPAMAEFRQSGENDDTGDTGQA